MQTCPTSQISMLTVSTSRVETRARKDLPCRVKNAPRQSMRHCVEEYYQKKTECRLPWGDKDKLGNLMECNSTTEPVLFADFLDDLPKSKQGLFKLTGCHHQCEYLVSNGFLDKDFPTNNYVLLIFFYFGLQAFYPKIVLQNSYPRRRTLSHVVIINLVDGVSGEREVLAMDALELIANVGGYLGLLLGFSFWSACKVFIRRAEARVAMKV